MLFARRDENDVPSGKRDILLLVDKDASSLQDKDLVFPGMAVIG
jgi:hypothetical protein